MPPPSRPSWAQEIDSWLAAVDTLVEAEEAPEAAEVAVEDAVQQATLAFKSRLPPQTQIMEVVPTHDDQGAPVQLFESPADGSLHDLPWDAPDQQTDAKFVKVLKAEYTRSGPLQVLRDRVLEAPHGCTRDFKLVGGVLWRTCAGRYQLVLGEDSPLREDAFWQQLMRLMGVKVARTTPYKPRSDGQAEGTNRVVEDTLRSFVDANAADWDLYATNVEFAINDSRCESTGFTPFELCCGVSPLSQLDMFLEAAKLDARRRTGG
ncbi:hypothetical protein CYMTET_16569 [Cymbomonas tetramitiformis]|uniref:Integrase catalytic domain-containing protein n=1 Tax=Cymbomonas tetramitiformis TaxID=36881 RepID=A0AAE0GC54_9CHLO|nr:hypothetical protein CYMTET_16569 [Cymbomonas tetramitiformis]